jgi:hypothetical protein
MRALFIALLLALTGWTEPVKWSITYGTSGGVTGGGRAHAIQSSGDILLEEWAATGQTPSREVTGYVNREELDILERMLADPQLHKAQASKPTNHNRFLKFTYGDIKKSFTVGSEAVFPEPVERLSKEVARALSAAKQ